MTAASPQSRYRWVICGLLFFATTVNYIDRQILSLLKPILDEQLHWSNYDFGRINSAFQASYGVSVFFFGWFIDKYGTKLGYAVSIAAWSAAAVGHALVNSIGGFFGARVALGMGEGGNFPAAIKATAQWFPKKERALATSLFNSGANVGAIIAPAVVPPIAYNLGWHWAFIFAGLAGFGWLVLWWPLFDYPEKSRRVSAAELAYIESDAPDPSESSAKVCVGGGAAPPPGVVVHRRQVPHRPGLVVFPDVAAGLLQEDAAPRYQEQLDAPGQHLRDRHRAEHRRRLGDGLSHGARLGRHPRAQDRHVRLRAAASRRSPL